MVDFSCALKLAMPISVLSAIREANQHKITVKGGKVPGGLWRKRIRSFSYKTGTLTKDAADRSRGGILQRNKEPG